MAQWINLSEQQIRIVDANYIHCEKNLTHTCSGTRSYGQVAVGQNTGEFGIFLKIRLLLCSTKVQHHYSSENAFQVFFRVKFIVKLVV